MPEISVIVPVYNIQDYVSECVDSILKQSFRDFELILVDDGSTDSSGNICDSYMTIDSRIKVIHKKNGGLSDARNVGMMSAKGKYFSFIDGDDTVSLVYLEILYNTLKEQDADIVQGGFSNKRERLVLKSETKPLYCFDKEEAIHDYLHRKKLYVSSCAKIYNRKLFDNVIFPIGKINEDNFTTYKLIANSTKCVVCEQTIYWHRINKNSITRSSFNPHKLEVLQVPNEMRDFWRVNNNDGLSQDINYYEFRLNLSVYNRLLAQTSSDEYEKEKRELRFFALNYKNLDESIKIKVAIWGIRYLHPAYSALIRLAFKWGKIA